MLIHACPIVFEIQTLTLCDGWTNTWTIHHEDGSSEPERFATKAEAQAALDEFLAEIAEEIAIGIREPDQGYDWQDFRIVALPSVSIDRRPA
jgi:hypothetical protein